MLTKLKVKNIFLITGITNSNQGTRMKSLPIFFQLNGMNWRGMFITPSKQKDRSLLTSHDDDNIIIILI